MIRRAWHWWFAPFPPGERKAMGFVLGCLIFSASLWLFAVVVLVTRAVQVLS